MWGFQVKNFTALLPRKAYWLYKFITNQATSDVVDICSDTSVNILFIIIIFIIFQVVALHRWDDS